MTGPRLPFRQIGSVAVPRPLAVITGASTGIDGTIRLIHAIANDMRRRDQGRILIGSSDKAHASNVAKTGFDAMMKGELKVVAGFANKLRAAVAHVAPDSALADINRGMAEPGTGKAEEPRSKRKRTDRPRA